MSGHLKCNQLSQSFQATFARERPILDQLLTKFAPPRFRKRRNANHVKMRDETLLTLMCLRAQFQIRT